MRTRGLRTNGSGQRARASPEVWGRLGFLWGLTLRPKGAGDGSDPPAVLLPARPSFPIAGMLQRPMAMSH